MGHRTFKGRAHRARWVAVVWVMAALGALASPQNAAAQAAGQGKYHFAPPYYSEAYPSLFSTDPQMLAERVLAMEQQKYNDPCTTVTVQISVSDADVIESGGDDCVTGVLDTLDKTLVSEDDGSNDGDNCPSDGTSTCAGDPINTATGNVTQIQTDGSWGEWLKFERFYNSSLDAFTRWSRRLPNGNNSTGYLGVGWTHTYFRKIYYQPPDSKHATPVFEQLLFETEDGREYAFARIDGQLKPADFDFETQTTTERKDIHLEASVTTKADGTPNGFIIYRPDTHAHEYFNGKGLLQKIVGADGLTTNLTYSTASTSKTIASSPGLLITVTDPVGKSLHFVYDNFDFLVSITGPDGQAIQFKHTISNQAGPVVLPNGLTRTYVYSSLTSTLPPLLHLIAEDGEPVATLTYDAKGNATSVAHADNAGKVEVTYRDDGYAKVVYAEGATQTLGYRVSAGHAKLASVDGACQSCGPYAKITYDDALNPVTRVDWVGNVTNASFNAQGMETSRTEAFGTPLARTTQTDWNVTLHKPTQSRVLDAEGKLVAKEAWRYNARGQVTADCVFDAQVNPTYTCAATGAAPASVRRTVTAYCEAVTADCPKLGLIKSIDGPRTDVSDITTFTYKDGGVLASQTDPMGHTTQYLSNDGAGRVLRKRTADGVITDYTYDAMGNLLTTTVRAKADGSASSADAVTTHTYDRRNRMTGTTDADGVSINYAYDAAGRMIRTQDSLGNRQTMTYDVAGNRLSKQTLTSSSKVLFTERQSYSSTGRALVTTDGNDKIVRTFNFADSYDKNARPVRGADGRGTESRRTYDALGRLATETADAVGITASSKATISYDYDALDHVALIEDPEGLVTTQSYDGLGNLVSRNSPNSGQESWKRDLAGNVVSHTDARGVTVTFAYDAAGRKVSETYPNSSDNVIYRYDEPQSLTGCQGLFSAGRLTRMLDSSGTTTYCYDNQGRVVEQRHAQGSITDTTDYVYTNAGRVAAVASPNGLVTEYTRNALGQVTAITSTTAGGTPRAIVKAATYVPFGPLASYTLGNGQVVMRTFDKNLRVSDVTGGSLNLHFSRDIEGNIVALGNAEGASPAVETYAYDPQNRLTTVMDAAGAVVEAYAYNKTGDRLSKTGSGQATGTYGYQANSHWLTSIGVATRAYNADGATTGNANAGRNWEFSYNGRGQLTDLRQGDSAVATYGYDGEGTRVSKSVGGAQTRYAFDADGDLLSESGATSRDYIWLGGTPVAVLDGSNAAAVTRFIAVDHLDTPRAMIDDSGSVVWTWSLKGNPFGEASPERTGEASLPIRFPGQYLDVESGNVFNHNRYYDPATGRYLQSDPLGLAAGPSAYLYASGNPSSLIDPLGLESRASSWARRGAIYGGTTIFAASLVADAGTVGVNVPFTPAEVGAGSAIGAGIGYVTGSIADLLGGDSVDIPASVDGSVEVAGADATYAKGGKQNWRDEGLRGYTDEEIDAMQKDPATSSAEKKRLVREQKARKNRNKSKRNGC